VSEDLASLFSDPPEQPSQDVRYRQGVIITIDQDTLENTVNVGGTILTNLTVLSTGDARLLLPGAVVGVLAVGTSTKSMFITGRIIIPNSPEAESANLPGTPGVISGFAGPGPAPFGYLICNGAAVSRTTYSDLFLAIGTTWGAGDGLTTFNLPELRNMFFVGAGLTYSVGATGGAATHTHAHAATHTHGHSATHTHATSATHTHGNPGTGGAGGHDHGGGTGTPSATVILAGGAVAAGSSGHTHGIGSDGSHSHSLGSTDAASPGTSDSAAPGTSDSAAPGTSDSASSLPPFAALTPIIRY
jgi:microcystin-dependent protein